MWSDNSLLLGLGQGNHNSSPYSSKSQLIGALTCSHMVHRRILLCRVTIPQYQFLEQLIYQFTSFDILTNIVEVIQFSMLIDFQVILNSTQDLT